jgi:hypothetical protein
LINLVVAALTAWLLALPVSLSMSVISMLVLVFTSYVALKVW